MALVILPMGALEGRFYEIQYRPRQNIKILNFGSVHYERGALVSSDIAFGGVYVLDYLEKVIHFLSKTQFKMIAPQEFASFVELIDVSCPKQE